MAEGTNPDPGEAAELRRLAGRAGDLKRELVAFAGSKRFDRWREPELRKAAEDDDGTPPPPGSDRWVQAMDDFVMTFRFPDGTGVIDRFLAASGKSLHKSDRRLLEGWLDPVDGIFELRDKDAESLTLFDLIDELEYRAYSSLGFAHLTAETGSFILGRLVPLRPGAWTPSGSMSQFPREHAKVVAQLALEWLQARPSLAFRNPAKRERGWELMRKDRDEFVEFFGADQVIVPAEEALDQINAYYRAHEEKILAERDPAKPLPEDLPGTGDRPYFTLPEGALAGVDTVGVMFDEKDGMSLLPAFGELEELFADPSLANCALRAGGSEGSGGAAGQTYADILLGYLDSDSIYPGPLRRLAAAHPDTVDDVYRKILKKPTFTWEKSGELLLRKRKPWYFKQERYPKTTPVSDYLLELLAGIR